MKKNTEMHNYSLDTDYSYISKQGCRFGIILASDYYINLDVGLINYYFDRNFSDYPWTAAEQGLKMDRGEKTILYKGKLLMKEMYAECETLQSLIDGRTVYNNKTENDKMSAHQMMIQIEGNTILHLYSIDFEPLSLMLAYMEKRKSNMLNSILMKNHQGLTPIEVAIKFESQKTINLLLQYLSKLVDGSYSRLLQTKFNKLLSMNLISFHQYLDSCSFQTIQMKSTKFLKLKSDEEKLVVTHTSCLIDETFLKQYTHEIKKGDKKKASPDKKNSKSAKFREDIEEIEEGHSYYNESGSEDELPEIPLPDSDEEEAEEQDDEEDDHFYNEESMLSAQKPRESNNFSHKNFKGNESALRESEIELKESQFGDDEYEGEESEEIDEGGEEQKNKHSEAAGKIKTGGQSNPKKKEELKGGPDYDPSYNVLTTENRVRTTEMRDIAKSEEIEDIDDYFRKNVSSNEDDIRKIRTEKIVPPNEIKATEMEEKRLKEFELKMKNVEGFTKKVDKNDIKTLRKLDTKSLTKEQIAMVREAERVEYYRKNIKSGMPVLNIRAIEFDWLFGNEGTKFLRTMADTESIELFSLGIVKEIIQFFWSYYKIRIVITGLIPFLIHFCIFIAYATFLHWEDEDHGKSWNDWRYLDYACRIATLAFAAYFLIFELLYF